LRRKKAEPKTPHFLSLNQDIVAWSQEEKCKLKYVMFSLSRPEGTLYISDLENGRPSMRMMSICRIFRDIAELT